MRLRAERRALMTAEADVLAELKRLRVHVPQLTGARLVQVRKTSATLAIGQSETVSELRTSNGSIHIRTAGQ